MAIFTSTRRWDDRDFDEVPVEKLKSLDYVLDDGVIRQVAEVGLDDHGYFATFKDSAGGAIRGVADLLIWPPRRRRRKAI
jgi:hypothetical protein